ncbi:hypothetical protein V6N13_013784 [Hibiscus sabdariffa]|uniref:Uncharacterized protein n=1 Tax=Hibiscus sabdariffa TaxID=183260 RepID=A0ABR2P380_9ROSI
MGLVASPSQLPLLYILENHDPIRMDRKRRKVKIEEQNQINSAMDDNETPALEPDRLERERERQRRFDPHSIHLTFALHCIAFETDASQSTCTQAELRTCSNFYYSSPHPSAGHLGSGLELGSPAKYLLVQSTSVLV